jgi:diguanylate cyclase (GGDEF)-like protein
MVAQAGARRRRLVAIMFDLDHFKRINDIHGHAKGDEVLATVAAVVQSCVRESDFVGRYGGEEFASAASTCCAPPTARSTPRRTGRNRVMVPTSVDDLVS